MLVCRRTILSPMKFISMLPAYARAIKKQIEFYDVDDAK